METEADEASNNEDTSMTETSDVYNADNGWEDILGNGKVVKKALIGGTGSRPNMGSLVHVSYKVYSFQDLNTKFTDVESLEPIFKKEDSFFLGEGDASLHALELGIALMNVGEKAVIRCVNPMLGYEGEPPEFRPDGIVANSKLFIFVELLRDDGPPVPWSERSLKERLPYAKKKVERGNAYCRATILSSAINAYSAALKILGTGDGDEEEPSEADEAVEQEIRFMALSGLSAAHFNSLSFENALKSCEDALNICPKTAKLIFRRGRCLAQLGQLEEAKRAILLAKDFVLADANKFTSDFIQFVDNELKRVQSKLRQDNQRESELYRRMIDIKPMKKSNSFSSKGKSIAMWLTSGRMALIIFSCLSSCIFLWIIAHFVLTL